jgi:hypothetical protein
MHYLSGNPPGQELKKNNNNIKTFKTRTLTISSSLTEEQKGHTTIIGFLGAS